MGRLRQLGGHSLLPTITSLYALQMAGYLLPLASFPYLIRVLGPETFGLYAFVTVVARYLIMLTDYGFTFSATRDIATIRGRGDDTSRSYGAAVTARIWILAACALLLAVLTIWVPRFSADAGLFWLGFAGVAGSALFPQWLFQAFERLPLVTSVGLGVRTVSTVLIFVLVRDETDVSTAVALWSAPWIVLALFGLWAGRRVLGVRLRLQPPREVLVALRSGISLFIAIVAGSLYTTSNALILGLMAGYRPVGYFVAAETVVIALRGLLDPLAQALFPRAALVGARSTEAMLQFARRALRWIGGIGAVLSAGTLVLAPLLGPLVFGAKFEPSVPLLQIMSILPLSVAVVIVLGTQLMLPLRMDRAYTTIVLVGGVMNIAVTLILVPFFTEVGTAIAAATTETVIAIALGVYVHRRGLGIFGSTPKAAGA